MHSKVYLSILTRTSFVAADALNVSAEYCLCKESRKKICTTLFKAFLRRIVAWWTRNTLGTPPMVDTPMRSLVSSFG